MSLRGCVGAIEFKALTLRAFPYIALRSGPPVLGKGNAYRDEVLLTH